MDNQLKVGENDTTLVPANPSKQNTMNVYIHYMPWFVPPTSTDVWNHWTMSTNALLPDESNIASHFHPLTGAYSSADDAILDYQCLLMKYAGADGIFIDWYGTQQINDYPQNETNTQAIVSAIERAQLKFALVYEDATLSGTSNKAQQAWRDMRYVSQNYAQSKYYTKVDNKPLLLIFGPQQLTSPADWDYALNAFAVRPEMIVLNGFSSKANDAQYQNAQGEFLWVNPSPQYADAKQFDTYIGDAMPGFDDVYSEHNQGAGYTTYDRADGTLFSAQLEAASAANLQWVQISTWNDYGEGTTIEPTAEYKYQYLTLLQQFTGVQYGQHELELIYRWYKLRVAKSNEKLVQQAYTLLNALQPNEAEIIIQSLE